MRRGWWPDVLGWAVLVGFAAGCGQSITAREARDWREPGAATPAALPPASPTLMRDLAVEAAALPQPRRQVVEVALAMTGSPATGFDCSSFAVQVFGAAGTDLPRTVVSQSRAGRAVTSAALQPGDLVFFAFERPPADHVGIYLGRGAFAHVSSSTRHVRIEALAAPEFARTLVGSRRLLD